MSEASAPRLAARGITKRFPGVLALDAVDLELEPGEILAVIGENGAGKSTLMKVLDGIHAPDAGTLEWQGRPLVIRSPREARERGIALIHQELELAENLTVAENLFLGCEPRDRLGLLDRSLMARRAGELLARIEADFAPGTPVAGLAPGQRQMVEIARALGTEAEVLIFDEPTSSLSQRETELLFRLIRELRDANRSVVYISHALTEVERLADRVLVLRDGSAVGTFARGELDKQGMVRAMVGRDLGQARQRSAELGAVRLSVEGVDCITCHAIPAEQGGGVAGTITDRGAACQPVQRVELQRPVLCAGCHDQHQTMQQWEGSSWAEKRITCIDCHMPFREGDPNLGRDHRCLGGNDLEMIQSAVELSARVVEAGVAVSVANVGAGHSFPTDERSRAADVFWRTMVAGEPGPWQHVYRFRSPYRDETHLPDTLLPVDSTWTQTIEGAEPPLEVALFYKRSPYWADPENPDPENEADYLVHRLTLEP